MTHKHLFLMLAVLMSVAVCSMTFVSCDDDEIESGDGSSSRSNGKAPKNVRAVDLGLPSGTLWANMNVGAIKEEGFGDYFAWGETKGFNSGKTDFSWSTYKLCNGSSHTMTKYCKMYSIVESGYIYFTDNKIELDPEDDAAYVNWGAEWRMPTYGQWNELKSNCTWIEKTMNDINGYKVIGSNGNAIFLPAAGYRNETSFYGAGSGGNYWSRSLVPSMSENAWLFDFFYGSFFETGYGDRDHGLSVRPVRATE